MKFWKKILRIVDFEKLVFFESAILIFFCFIPMKISHKLCVRMDGTQFLSLWWCIAKNVRGNRKWAWVQQGICWKPWETSTHPFYPIHLAWFSWGWCQFFPPILNRKMILTVQFWHFLRPWRSQKTTISFPALKTQCTWFWSLLLSTERQIP